MGGGGFNPWDSWGGAGRFLFLRAAGTGNTHDLLAEDLLRQVMDHPLVRPEETTTAKALHGGG